MGNEKFFQTKKLKYIANVLDQFRKPITADKRNQNADVLYDYYGASGVIDKIDGYTIDDHVMLIGEDGANLRLRNLPLMYEVNGKAWINNHAHILKPKVGTDFYFLFYALESIDINPYVTGSAQPKLNQENLKEIPVPFPPIDEQKKIANFLDEKCSEIDSILSDVQREIEILNDYKKSVITEAVTKGLNSKAKLKDTGIEWIGKIPEEWDVVPIKRVLKDIKDGTHATFNRVAEGLFLLSAKNVFDDGIHIGNNESCISENDYLSIIANGFPKRNDVLLSIVGTIGRCCVYQEDKPMAFQRSVAFLRANEKILPYFLVYSLRSRATEEEEKQKINGTAQMGLYLGDVCSLRIAVPPLSEQEAIADYLDEKCSEIDATIADKQRQLETLDEYKKSLIFEYVTGKKEVS